MSTLDVTANACYGPADAASTPTPMPAEPAPQPTPTERARATACEYTGMGCDVVEDASQTTAGRTRQTTEAGWFGRTEDGGVAIGDHTLSDGSNMRIGHVRPGVGRGEATLFHVHTSPNAPLGVGVDLGTFRALAGANGEPDEMSVGGELSMSLVDITHTVRGDNWNVDVTGSVGAGGGASVRHADEDGDGLTEVCGRVAAGPVALDGCVELNEADSARADAFFEAAYEFTPQRIIYHLSR